MDRDSYDVLCDQQYMDNDFLNDMCINFFSLVEKSGLMASYSEQVNVIHKKFQNAVKSAKTKQSLNKAYSVHKKDHERLLKKHLREETTLINKAKKKLE